MATNKEKIELFELSVGGLHDSMSDMELGVNNKLHQLKAAINRISETISPKQDPTSSHAFKRNEHSWNGNVRDRLESNHPMFSSKLARLEFLRYSGDDPIEWLTRVEQFFEY